MSTKISSLTAAVGIDGTADYLPIVQSSTTKKINRTTLLNITGSPVGTSDSQVLSHKTLGVTNIITINSNNFTLDDYTDPTKQAVFDLASITTGTLRTYTLPNATTTLVGTGATQTLTNKTLTSPTINSGTIDNATITVDSISGHSSSTVVTVANLQISNGVLNTNNSVVTANIAAGAVTNAKLAAEAAWTSYTPSWTNLTISNGAQAAYYQQIGRIVLVHLYLTFGSGTSISGAVTFTLPVNSVTTYGNTASGSGSLGLAEYEDNGNNNYHGYVYYSSATKAGLNVWVASGTYLTGAALSSTVPFTFGTGDEIRASFSYEAAS